MRAYITMTVDVPDTCDLENLLEKIDELVASESIDILNSDIEDC